ncbi:hypothetical protein R1sor_014489 [Riccia sorocarpa]|uniref:Uncharacterized protein n=1 Tax=Riccia sorocarpa TaxID=122646 RepID=A0ABD3HCQ1_9MARC
MLPGYHRKRSSRGVDEARSVGGTQSFCVPEPEGRNSAFRKMRNAVGFSGGWLGMDMDFDSNIDDWNEDIDLVEEDWEALNGNRWYQENPAISYRTDAVASEGGTTLDDWQRSIRNVRREIDIGGKTL